ncbi:MAG: metal ABC transporter substrate-binding protein [Myxococcota bacterium]|jgi:ABC-type Zn uptake system ZnuABC Zn-binding protein ZnuA|nr:metal ABC transporter substrate-binding protein [Myxococcota bacterium]
MKYRVISVVLALGLVLSASTAWAQLKVVATLPDYKDLAERIGGDRVTVQSLVLGDQDAHFIRPKPSFIVTLSEADVLISTGMDLELWLPTIVDKSGNEKIRSEQVGYVSASDGMSLLEVPESVSRSEGGVHLYGNPHVTTNPLNMKVAARNITAGLIKNDPDGEDEYMKRLEAFEDEVDERLFGKDLVRILGGKTLTKLALKGTLIEFLEKKEYKGAMLIGSLGGWMGAMMPLRGKKIVCYHKNWVYFSQLFGLVEAEYIEPKPGIPPSAKHVAEVIELMKAEGVKVILAASYFDQEQVKDVASKTGAEAIIAPYYVGSYDDVPDYFALVDWWTSELLAAAKKQGLIQ